VLPSAQPKMCMVCLFLHAWGGRKWHQQRSSRQVHSTGMLYKQTDRYPYEWVSEHWLHSPPWLPPASVPLVIFFSCYHQSWPISYNTEQC